MAFQLDQLSVHGLRRLVKDLRASLAQEGVDLPQHRVQEVLARTLGHATWHDAQQQAKTHRPHSEHRSPAPAAPSPLPVVTYGGRWSEEAVRQWANRPNEEVTQVLMDRAMRLIRWMAQPMAMALAMDALVNDLDAVARQKIKQGIPLDNPNTWQHTILAQMVPIWRAQVTQAPSGMALDVLNMMFPVFIQDSGLNTPDARGQWLRQVFFRGATFQQGLEGIQDPADQRRLHHLVMAWCVAPLFSEGSRTSKAFLLERLTQGWTHASPDRVSEFQADAYQTWMPHLLTHTHRSKESVPTEYVAPLLLPLLHPFATTEVLTAWAQQSATAGQAARVVAQHLFQEPPLTALPAAWRDQAEARRVAHHRQHHFVPDFLIQALTSIAGTERVADAGAHVRACLSFRAQADGELEQDPHLTGQISREALLRERKIGRTLEWLPVMQMAMGQGSDSMIAHLTEWLTSPESAKFWWLQAAQGTDAGHRTFQDTLQLLYPAELGHERAPPLRRPRQRP